MIAGRRGAVMHDGRPIAGKSGGVSKRHDDDGLHPNLSSDQYKNLLRIWSFFWLAAAESY